MYLNPEVLFVDEALLVINKPSGLLCLPDGQDSSKPHLRSILEPHYGRLYIVHRLDKETSGAVVLARTEESHRFLNDQFSNHSIEKNYRAILIGNPTWDDIEVEKALSINVGRRKRTVIDLQHGKSARTVVHILERFDEHALVEARPITGRTHQIRVHLCSLSHPILADPLYGGGEKTPLIDRLALHAHSITIIHPLSNEKATYEAAEPGDFMEALIVLRC